MMNELTQLSDQVEGDVSLPRLNGSMLRFVDKFHYAEVLMVGEFIEDSQKSYNGMSIKKFKACDDWEFEVYVPNDHSFDGYGSKFVQIRGIVLNTRGIKQTQYLELGDNFDMKNYARFVSFAASDRFKSLF